MTSGACTWGALVLVIGLGGCGKVGEVGVEPSWVGQAPSLAEDSPGGQRERPGEYAVRHVQLAYGLRLLYTMGGDSLIMENFAIVGVDGEVLAIPTARQPSEVRYRGAVRGFVSRPSAEDRRKEVVLAERDRGFARLYLSDVGPGTERCPSPLEEVRDGDESTCWWRTERGDAELVDLALLAPDGGARVYARRLRWPSILEGATSGAQESAGLVDDWWSIEVTREGALIRVETHARGDRDGVVLEIEPPGRVSYVEDWLNHVPNGNWLVLDEGGGRVWWTWFHFGLLVAQAGPETVVAE